MDRPGIAVFLGAFDGAVIDRATDAFSEMLGTQRAAGLVSGDHYAKPGANDRIWGALDKLAVAHPEVFFDYYANDVVALASRAWLGPNYQVTSVQHRQPRRAGADRASRLPPGLHAAGDRGELPGARAPVVPVAHPAARRRAL
jgi:ectoine hydroxylase-related dioxygenase (phytanoyl-CoA dioxygenase family)